MSTGPRVKLYIAQGGQSASTYVSEAGASLIRDLVEQGVPFALSSAEKSPTGDVAVSSRLDINPRAGALVIQFSAAAAIPFGPDGKPIPVGPNGSPVRPPVRWLDPAKEPLSSVSVPRWAGLTPPAANPPK